MAKSFRVNGLETAVNLASGGVIDWNNGDVTLTHAADLLTLGGGSFTVTSGSINVGAAAGAYGLQVSRSVNNDYVGIITNSFSGANSYGLRVVTTGSTSTSATVFEASSLGASKTFSVFNDGHVVAQGTMTATGYVAGASTGIDFSGAVTNITVVKGIVTAAS